MSPGLAQPAGLHAGGAAAGGRAAAGAEGPEQPGDRLVRPTSALSRGPKRRPWARTGSERRPPAPPALAALLSPRLAALGDQPGGDRHSERCFWPHTRLCRPSCAACVRTPTSRSWSGACFFLHSRSTCVVPCSTRRGCWVATGVQRAAMRPVGPSARTHPSRLASDPPVPAMAAPCAPPDRVPALLVLLFAGSRYLIEPSESPEQCADPPLLR